MFNINDNIKKVTKEFGLGSGFHKFENGDNKIRVLAVAHKPIVKHFINNKPFDCTGPGTCEHHKEKASVKYPSYIIDRKDNAIKKMDLVFTVYKQIGRLQLDEDYAFDDLPMPYDIKVNYDENASPSEMYKVIPSPERKLVDVETLEALRNLPSLNELKDEDIPVVEDDEKKITEEDLPF